MEKLIQKLWCGKFSYIKEYCALDKDDFLCVPIEADRNSVYRIRITIGNTYGNGRLYFNMFADEEFDFGLIHLDCPIDPSGWRTYDVEVATGNIPDSLPFIFFRITRSPGGTGIVLVDSISFEKLPRGMGPTPEPRLLNYVELDDFENIMMEGSLMDELEQQTWRGKHLVVKKDERGVKCQSMEGDRSVLFIPVKVEPNAMYRLHLDLRCETGNGKLFCNFYANRSFDFSQVALVCEAGAWNTFDVQAKTGAFPANLPIVLRLWRSPGGTGSLLVKRISLEKLPSGTVAEEPKVVALSANHYVMTTQPAEPILEPKSRRGKRPQLNELFPNVVLPSLLPSPSSLPSLPSNLNYSHFNMRATRVLVVSEAGDETITCNAFTANGILCEGMALTDDVHKLPAFVTNRSINWIHFHIGKGTTLTPQIVDQIRDAVPGIIVTIWMIPYRPIFDNNLLALLCSADIALMETEMELATYRNAGCFNAELWDPGAATIASVNYDVVLLTNGREECGELIKACTQRFGDRFLTIDTHSFNIRQTLPCGAKVVLFTDLWPSRILFGLLAAKVPVVAKRSIATMEWCEDGSDLRLFETPDEGVKMVVQLLTDQESAKTMGERAAHTATLHSNIMRVRELAVRLGCFEAVAPNMPKDRTSYTFKRMLCAMRLSSWELMAKNSNQDIDFMAASFTECQDLAAKIVRFNPDLLYIHLEMEDDGLPWRDLLLDLRRRLPNMLVTVFHPGGSVDGCVLDLRFSVDHILVGDANSAEQYHALSLKGVQTWKPTAMPFENPEVFRDDMLAFARSMADRRTAFLRSAEGQLVDLTVFIGTCNRFDPLRRAVETALASAHQRSVEIIVNDAGSTDGTQEWLRNISVSNRRIVPIFSDKRTSFTQAFNESLQIAKGKYICWLSDDIVSEAHALFDMCAIMDSVTPMDMGGFCVRNSWGHEYTVRRDAGYFFPTVGCMYTETLRKLNGINMDYPYYSQDTDLDMRVMRLGGRIIAATHCRLLHNCANDELRRSNSNNHTNTMGDVKYTLAAWYPGQTSRFPYPTVLLMPAAGCSKDDILMVARRVRSQYSNSHMFVAGETSESLDTRESNSFLRKIPTTNTRTPLLFNLVVRIEPGKGVLVRPPDRSDMPFVRHMLSGQS